MVDVSDGLVADLRHVAAASGVVINLVSKALDVADPLRDAAAAMGKDPLEWVLTGGEDHALAATFPATVGAPPGWTTIGMVTAGDADVRLDGRAVTGQGGWTHLGGPR